MKSEKGITLTSLVIYVIVMTIIIYIMSLITAEFYKNTDMLQGNVKQVLEFNKFNTYFLREVKTTNNSIKTINTVSGYIAFESGNEFSINNGAIYYNTLKICDGLTSFSVSKESDTVVEVTLNFGNFTKTIKYKIENIY